MIALSLYSGGCDGLSLAASWAGIETAAMCECDARCRTLLEQRSPGKPIFEYDTEVTPDGLRANGIDPDDIGIILASPPCQCASVAGKRLGADDPRNRWPECLRIVRDVRPRWFMAENVPGLLSVDAGRLFGDLLRELAELGYDAGWCVYGAADVGAPHKRDRLCIVAHARHDERPQRLYQAEGGDGAPCGEPASCGDVADAACAKRERPIEHGDATGRRGLADGGAMGNPHSAGREECGSPTITSAARHSSGERAYVRDAKRSGRKGQPRRRAIAKLADGCLRGGRHVESRLGGIAHGVSDRLDAHRWPAGRKQEQYDYEPPRVTKVKRQRPKRLKILGNAVVPQWAYVVLACIAEIERRSRRAARRKDE